MNTLRKRKLRSSSAKELLSDKEGREESLILKINHIAETDIWWP